MLPLLLLACTAPTPAPPARDEPDTHAVDTHDTDPTDTSAPRPPIVLVVLADDLGANFAWAMETVQARLVPESVSFTRAYATVPLCCPVRASFLSGGYTPAATNVHGNGAPNGGYTAFADADTLATRLQAQGWATALLGKYLNGWEVGGAPYVPPGWDLFLSHTEIGDSTDAVILRGSSTPDASGIGTFEDTGGEHLTGWVFDEALAFLDAHPDQPTFVLLTPHSPHIYGSPAPEDEGSWAGYQFRPAAFAEADVTDKPGWIQLQTATDAEMANWDRETILMLENLASLDRAMGTLLDGLEARGLLDDTTLVFTSDNGHLHGEHRLVSKGVAYEESVHVPLYVRATGLEPREDSRLVAMNLDLPATIGELTGVTVDGFGVGLSAALTDTSVALRDHVFLETSYGTPPVWAGLVTERWKYVEWGSGETELYDLVADPSELTSLHAAPPEDVDVAAFSEAVAAQRGLVVTTRRMVGGAVGVPYSAELTSWGGTAPLTWSLAAGSLPGGVLLAADGTITGTPTEAGTFTFEARVTDSGVSPFTGEPATFGKALSLTIGDAPRMACSATWEGDTATFVVPARPGVQVEVLASVDPTFDVPPVRSGPVRVGADGAARVRIPRLDPTRVWHWRADVDGVLVPGGVLRHR